VSVTILAADSVSGFFQEVVEDAMRSRHADVTNGAQSYLVSLLVDYTHPGEQAGATMQKPLAFLLDEALRTPDRAERFERLRSLGDGVLYACGFFGDHFEARGVDQRYLFGIGSAAYDAAGSILRLPSADDTTHIFDELSRKFGTFVDVLADVADSTIAMGTTSATSKNLLKVYERWLRTGSDRLAHALTSHGLVPTRGVKGVQ
jgi:hypothetical protein